jgi:hypothetical protein
MKHLTCNTKKEPRNDWILIIIFKPKQEAGMNLPTKIQNLCVRYLDLVRSDPDHHLKIEYRFDIYNGFGSSRLNLPGYIQSGEKLDSQKNLQYMKEEFLNFNINDYALGWLAILTARYVLPISDRVQYQLEFNKQRITAQEVLQVAENLLQHRVTFDMGNQELEDFYWYNEDVFKSTTYDVACAFSSAYRALEYILYGIIRRDTLFIEGSDIIGGDIFTFKAVEAYSSVDKNPPGIYNQYALDEEDNSNNEPIIISIMNMNIINGNQYWQLLPLTYSVQKRLEFWEWWLTEAIPQAWELAEKSVADQK